MKAYQNGQYPEMYTYIVFIALCGLGSNWLLAWVSSHLCRGQSLEHGGQP